MFTRYRLILILSGIVLTLLIAGCAAGAAAGEPRAAAPAAAALAAGQEPMPRTVNVSGWGTASAAPDVAYVRLGVQIMDTNAEQAVAESTRRMTAVMNAIKEMGIAEKDVQTTQYTISVQQQYDREGQPTGEITYRVINQIQVTLRDLSRTGELLQKTLAAGANTVSGVTFSVEDPKALQEQARDAAIADARAKAEQLATGLGAQLGPVRQISESGGRVPLLEVARPMEVRAAAVGGEVPIAGGELSISVQIQVTFDLVE